ncbi:PH domain-containing protein [Mucilaginibacter sp. cycad4]|uniref:PH domain-containing protein n=1 Tax=Mucilaginibacter sp. cycad4 TaxID=3342096 RepID=UPI002AAAC202|nr:PH domain-containing protein [Mucilaginibacter gossypii]WPV00738.1 PH domain-containing protein [Mucilaginibacter gossypii]
MIVVSFLDKAYVGSCILVAVMIYLIWMWYDTYYSINGNQLFYKSALLNGTIEIDTIVEIVKTKNFFIGLKPSLSAKGIIIKYKKYDDIYISPQNIDQFIRELKQINPAIKTTE